MQFLLKRMMRKGLVFAILSVSAAGMLPLGAQEQTGAPKIIKIVSKYKFAPDRKIPLRINYIPDPKATDPNLMAEQAVIRAFRKKYPFIELSAFTGISIPGMQDESRLMLAIAGGMAPDILNVNFRMSDTYIQQGFLFPLDEFLDRDYPGGTAAYMNSMARPIRPVAQREGPSIAKRPAGTHVWLMPGSLLVRVLRWRKDLLMEAGLDPDRPPKDWQELYEYVKLLSDPAHNHFGIQLSGGSQSSWDFVTYLWSAGGDAVAKDKDGNWVAAFGSREAAEALDFYVMLATERWTDSDGKTQYGYSALSADQQANSSEKKIAFETPYLNQQSVGSGIDPSMYGIAPFPPQHIGGTGKTELNARMNGIFSGIEGRRNSEGVYIEADEIREAAWLYTSFWNSDEANKIRADVLVACGAGRTLSPEWLRKYGHEEYLKYFPESFERVYNQAVENGVPEPYGRNCQLVYLEMTKPMDEALQLARDKKLPQDREERLAKLQEILTKAANQTTVQMIGHLTPEERSYRNNWAVVVAIIILSIFSFAIWKIWQIFSPKDTYSGKKKGWEFATKWGGYLIMIPALVSILVWVYVPMFSGSRILFQEFRFVGESQWTGLNNLADVLFSAEWWAAIVNTLRYMVLILALGFFAPIILAILLQEVSHCKLLYRTLFYLPAVMSGLVVIYMWRLFYGAGPAGVLNQVVQSCYDGINYLLVPVVSLFNPAWEGFVFQPIAWIEDSNWAMLSCILPTVWASAGPGCLIYLAALKGVPDDVYEAAEIDGANFFQKIWHVTLPTLKALIIINFVGAFIGAAQSGGTILVMTFGRANTEVAELHIFKEAYTNLRFGSAIAMAWILGITTLLFTIYNLKRLSNMEFKTTGK